MIILFGMYMFVVDASLVLSLHRLPILSAHDGIIICMCVIRVFDEKKNPYTIHHWFISEFLDKTGTWTSMSQMWRPTPSWTRAWAFTSTLTPLALAAAAVNPSSNLLVASTWLPWTDWVLPPLMAPVWLPKGELKNSNAFLAPCESQYLSNIGDKTDSIEKKMNSCSVNEKKMNIYIYGNSLVNNDSVNHNPHRHHHNINNLE